MGFETKWAGAAICPTRDRRAPELHRHGSWIERLLSSAVRTFVEGFAQYAAAYLGALYPGPFLPADVSENVAQTQALLGQIQHLLEVPFNERPGTLIERSWRASSMFRFNQSP